jgi:hypothetical protein
LKGGQKEWLRKREKCRDRDNPSECLLKVYRKRIGELAAWAGKEATEEQEAENRAKETQPLPEITAAVVWDGDAAGVHQHCDFGDYPCVLDLMRSTGASEQAMLFGARVEGWAYDFQELGAIDVVGWVAAFAANSIQGEYLVNGSPDLIDLSDYQLRPEDHVRADVRDMLTRFPDAPLFSHRFLRIEPIPNGTRFVVEADFAKCNACRSEVLARAEIAYDLDAEGAFQGSKLMRVVAEEGSGTAAPPGLRQSAIGNRFDSGIFYSRRIQE